MNKQRLQELAGIKPIDELNVNNPIAIYDRASKALCDLEVGIEFCDEEEIEFLQSIFDITVNETYYYNLSDLSYPIKSKEHLVRQILNSFRK